MKRIETGIRKQSILAALLWLFCIFLPLMAFAYLTGNSTAGMAAFGSGFIGAVVMVGIQRKKLNSFRCPQCKSRLSPDWSKSDSIVSKLSLRCEGCEKTYDTDFESTGAF